MDPRVVAMQAFYLMLIMAQMESLLYYKYDLVICPVHGLERVR